MIERRPHHDEKDWNQYYFTMDAITTRNPARVKPNCIDMLWAKAMQIESGELRADAFRALDELEEKVERSKECTTLI